MSVPCAGTTAHSGCRNGTQNPNRLPVITITTRWPTATARCPSPVSPPSMNVDSFARPSGNQQRLTGGNTEAFGAGRFQRDAVGRAAAEENLPAAHTPVPRDGKIIFQRPVFLRRTGERLDEEGWPGNLQFLPGKKIAGGGQCILRQDEFIVDLTDFQAALLQERKVPVRRDECVRCGALPASKSSRGRLDTHCPSVPARRSTTTAIPSRRNLENQSRGKISRRAIGAGAKRLRTR